MPPLPIAGMPADYMKAVARLEALDAWRTSELDVTQVSLPESVEAWNNRWRDAAGLPATDHQPDRLLAAYLKILKAEVDTLHGASRRSRRLLPRHRGRRWFKSAVATAESDLVRAEHSAAGAEEDLRQKRHAYDARLAELREAREQVDKSRAFLQQVVKSTSALQAVAAACDKTNPSVEAPFTNRRFFGVVAFVVRLEHAEMGDWDLSSSRMEG
jgi:hypothetical protein